MLICLLERNAQKQKATLHVLIQNESIYFRCDEGRRVHQRLYQKDIRMGIKEIVVELKYFAQEPVIKQIKRISKPGRRVYSDVSIPRYYSGLGVTTLSTRERHYV